MNKDFSYYLSKFLNDYLVIERNVSKNTIKSYKDSIKLLVEYLRDKKNIAITNINFKTVTRENVLDFLKYLEEEKNNSIKTRNQRLKAIKSFYEYCSTEEIENMNNITKILEIRYKKEPEKIIDYLTEEELNSVLSNIDTSTKKGRRNLMLISLMYDSAARASEIINLKVNDINLEENYVILMGKGNKERKVPLMKNTVELIKSYLKENNIKDTYLILNKKRYQVNERFFRDIVKKYTKFIDKNITPHCFRHSRAIHLLRAGVPLIVIRDLLGHTSVTTTEIYTKVLTEDKFKAIEKASPELKNNDLPDWNDDKDLLSHLLNL